MFDEIIIGYAMQFSVPEAWIRAVIQTESSFRVNPPVRAGDESYGLMQLTPATAKGLGFKGSIPGDLIDADTNIRLGTALLAELRGHFGDDAKRVYSAYNSGSPDKYLSSTQVAKNVARFVANLETAVSTHPFVASSGLLAPAFVFVALWFWTKKGKK